MRWRTALGALVAVRVLIPLFVLAAGGDDQLPLLPSYEWRPFRGDTPTYLGTALALLDGWRTIDTVTTVSSFALVGVVAVVGAACWRLGDAWRAAGVVAVALSFSVAFATAIAQMPKAPAGAIGWSLAWSVPIGALQAAGRGSVDTWVYGTGVAVLLAAHAVTVVAIAYAARYASGRREVGLVAAALYASWPVLSGLIGGSTTAANDQWAAETGLALYSEPLSTACIAVGTALVLSPAATALRAAIAGAAFAYAIVVRPPNALIALLAVLLLAARRDLRGVAAYAAGGAAIAPLHVAYLPKRTGYEFVTSDPSGVLFALEFVDQSWLHSSFWHLRTLAIVLPFAILGAIALPRRRSSAFLVLSVLAIAAFYSTFRGTEHHPRYILAALPALLVLVAAGATAVAKALARRAEALRAVRLS